MKQLFYYMLLICMLIGCKKKELMTYKGLDNVSFDYNGVRDSSLLTFRSTPATSLDAKVLVKLTGKVSTHDRLFKLSVDEDLSTARAGVNYEILTDTFRIAAGKTTSEINIRLLKNVDIMDHQYVLALRLMPNSNFKTELKSYVSTETVALDLHRLIFSNKMLINQDWNRFSSRLGGYFPKKVQLLVELRKMDLVRFYKKDGYSSSEYFDMARGLQLYLNQQRKLGNIILNDDGTVMTMGRGVQ